MAQPESAPRVTAGSARERMIQAGKSLFASSGYERASTSAIARIAGSSESQLIKHFGGKQGLLEAILDGGWQQITDQVNQSLAMAPNPAAKLAILSKTVISALDGDREMQHLFLFEGRRMRRQEAITVSKGFLNFVGLIDNILQEMQTSGVLRSDLKIQAVRSALMGMLEGMMRDLFLARTAGYPADYTAADLPLILSMVLRAMATR